MNMVGEAGVVKRSALPRCTFCGEDREERLRDGCFTCHYWADQAADRQYVLVTPDWTHYRLGEENVPHNLKGFAGFKWRIQYLDDGTVVTCSNLWQQGVIPEAWRKHFKVNGQIIR